MLLISLYFYGKRATLYCVLVLMTKRVVILVLLTRQSCLIGSPSIPSTFFTVLWARLKYCRRLQLERPLISDMLLSTETKQNQSSQIWECDD